MEYRPNREDLAAAVATATNGGRVSWTSRLRSLLDRHLAKISQRFPEEVDAIDASLEDVNGPRGGIDKRCRLKLRLKRRGHIAVSASSEKPEAAIALAVSRARHLLSRQLHKRRSRPGGWKSARAME
jgi:ribosome-associated translation inhibitor RaiA